MQTLSVVVNRFDLLVFQFRLIWIHPVYRWTYSLLFVFCFLTTLNRSPAFNTKYVVIAVLVGLVFAVAAALTGFLVMAVFVVLGVRAHRGTLGEHTFEINELGLVERGQHLETLVKWGGALRLLRSRRYIYVQFNAGLYYLIPRRYFGSVEEDRRFWDAIQPLVAGS